MTRLDANQALSKLYNYDIDLRLHQYSLENCNSRSTGHYTLKLTWMVMVKLIFIMKIMHKRYIKNKQKIVQREIAQTNAAASSKSKWTYTNP